MDLFKVSLMLCEKVFRSKEGKTVILRVYFNGKIEKVEITGDFFTDEKDLEVLENYLKDLKIPKVEIIGFDPDEILEKIKDCL